MTTEIDKKGINWFKGVLSNQNQLEKNKQILQNIKLNFTLFKNLLKFKYEAYIFNIYHINIFSKHFG